MLINFSDTSIADRLEYDVVIVGGGPAGITVARKVAQQGRKVALLEGGGLSYDQASQDLYAGETRGYEYPIQHTRLRFLGGTSNHWAGRCRPFEDIDFESRAEVYELPGWPIAKADMDAHLLEAMDILDLSGREFTPNEHSPVLPPNFEPDRALVSSPTRFGDKYRKELESSTFIDCYYNANAIDLTFAEGTQNIDAVVVKSLDGKLARFSGAKTVLAMGALENARLLLNANTQLQEGVGNKGGMVGRCFMEHFSVRMGEFLPVPGEWDGVDNMSFFTRPEYAEKAGIGCSNVTLAVGAKSKIDGNYLAVKRPLVNAACRYGFEDTLKKMIGFRCAGKGLISTLTEQEPNPDSRITLSDNVDALGVKKLVLDWQLSDLDRKTIRTIAKDLAKALADADVARVQLPDYILDESLDIPVRPHAHHTGTTRMSTSEKTGVVDENCKVFGTNNLYVAGASVFSRGGGNNPTMPLVQLALRLAQHLTVA